MLPHFRFAVVLLVPTLLAPGIDSSAQTPWVSQPGHGYAYLGVSRKTADTIWDLQGQVYDVPMDSRFKNHDFRYLFLNVEVGIVRRLSVSALFTYLDGFEGPDGHLERNTGFSDSWFGLKYAVREGALPMAVTLTVRSPFLYDLPGAYTRDLYDDEGVFLGHSPEWRGILKHDVTLSYAVGGSLGNGAGWASGAAGFTWREGAPADQLPFTAEIGHALPWRLPGGSPVLVKARGLLVVSLGNDSPRGADDRFGFREGSNQNLNDASMACFAGSVIVPFGSSGQYAVEMGYGRWVWGRSARRYSEPFASVGYRF